MRGMSLSEEGRAAMQLWLDDHPRGKHGKHEYRLEDYGIARAEVEALFWGLCRALWFELRGQFT